MTVEETPEGGEEGGAMGDLGKSLPDRGNSLCKGPEAGVEEQGGLCG